MSFFNNVFIEKEIKECLDILQESGHILSGIGFEDIKNKVESNLLKDKKEIAKIISQDGISPHEIVYFGINNNVREMLESGQYHVYRGVLNFMGNYFLNAFCISMDELVKMGAVSKDDGEEYKSIVKDNMNQMG
jgi:hypothetical protein